MSDQTTPSAPPPPPPMAGAVKPKAKPAPVKKADAPPVPKAVTVEDPPVEQPESGQPLVLDHDRQTVIMVEGSEIDVGADLRIEESDLHREFSQMPGKLVWWATLHQAAQEACEKEKINLNILEADLDVKLRKQYEDEGKKTTEAFIQASVRLRPEWRLQNDKFLYSRRSAGEISAVVEAMRTRRDMLISLGALVRSEMDAEGLGVRGNRQANGIGRKQADKIVKESHEKQSGEV